ncbi:DUF389 domain-containing protein [Wandonia haliotis]|uniref:DUF389 domain-containing protein n=2 Tax=Wandonia haliotis TaxID=574963 RepID=A0ABP3Y2F3_9FLAO
MKAETKNYFIFVVASLYTMANIKQILEYLKLDGDVDDFEIIHKNIEKDIIFKGTNLWILVFAIIVASVGLNMNSTAVIIGAMLISPLMGPINGMGYSIATYNFPLFRKAIKNFGFAVGASLVASTVYFAITPISTAHSELLARTSPTIYDVLIALFGGLAGIVAISSKQKGNVIPGVAIATALMPPLCTAGYGLATGQFYYFFGAFYLFTINTVFIAISAMVVSQILKFPIRTLVDTNRKSVVNRWISVVIVVTIIPSIYFGYGLVQKEKFIDNATKFVNNVLVFEGNFLIKNVVDGDRREVTLVYGGNALTDEQKLKIRMKAADFGLDRSSILVEQGVAFDKGDPSVLQVERLKAEMISQNEKLKEKDAEINVLKTRNDIGKELLAEIKTIYPKTDVCIYSEATKFTDSLRNSEQLALVVFHSYSEEYTAEEKNQIRKWIRQRLKTEAIRVYFYY